MAERMVEINGTELCTEALGNPAYPPILLIMGIGASMLWWEEGFERFVSTARVDGRIPTRSSST